MLLSAYGVPVKILAFPLGVIRGHLTAVEQVHRNTVLWIPGSLNEATTLWHGSLAEFNHELRHQHFLHDRAGLLLNLGGILTDMEGATGDRL